MSSDCSDAKRSNRRSMTPIFDLTDLASHSNPRLGARIIRRRESADAIRVFDGTTSDSTAEPPIPLHSMMVTSAPNFEATNAASYPPWPPPIMVMDGRGTISKVLTRLLWSVSCRMHNHYADCSCIALDLG